MKPPILMQSDFTRNTAAIAGMYGVCQSFDPQVKLFDANHVISRNNVFEASTSLAYLVEFWPRGTVLLSAVGLNEGARVCLARLKNGRYALTPDNGTLTHLNALVGVECLREVELAGVSLHERALALAGVAIRLASGATPFQELGRAYPLEEMVLIRYDDAYYDESDDAFVGVIHSAHAHFGLVCTNLAVETVKQKWGLDYGDYLDVSITNGSSEIFDQRVVFERSFGHVGIGEQLVFISSSLELEIATRNGNFVKELGIEAGPAWRMRIKRA